MTNLTPDLIATLRTLEAAMRRPLEQTGEFFSPTDPSRRGLSFAGGVVLIGENGDLLLPHLSAHIPANEVADVLARYEAAKSLGAMPTTEPER